MRQLNQSLMENLRDEPLTEIKETLDFRNRTFKYQKSFSTVSKTFHFVTREEIKFINMSNWLTGIFVITWGTQMVRNIELS